MPLFFGTEICVFVFVFFFLCFVLLLTLQTGTSPWVQYRSKARKGHIQSCTDVFAPQEHQFLLFGRVGGTILMYLPRSCF